MCMMQGLMIARNCRMQSDEHYRHKHGNRYGGKCYDTTCPHSSLDNMTPDEICYLTQETDGLQVA